jgi:CRP-like cAMP-binding protein
MEQNNFDDKTLRIRKILSTDKESRTKADIEWLLDEFIKMEYIKSTYDSYGELITTSIIKSMYWKEYKRGDWIYKQNDSSKYCYLLIKGLVEFIQPESVCKSVIKSILKPSQRRNDSLSMGEGKKLMFNVIETIEEGAMFGELEITERKERPATARCAKDCIVGEISKLDYINIFENTKRLEFNEEMRFLNSIQILKSCPGRTVQKIYTLLERRVCKQKELIAKQDRNCDCIYIVRKGSFECVYNLKTSYKSEYNTNYYQSLDSKVERFTASRVFELKDSVVKVEPIKVTKLQ